jgi:cytochrome c-type biogenesis protein CcmH
MALRLSALQRARSSSRLRAPAAVALLFAALGGAMLMRPAQNRSPTVATVVAPAPPPASAAHPLSLDRLERAVSQSRQRVAAEPKDAGAWAMLAHSYDMLGRYSDASAAYAKLIELRPDDAQVLVDAADSMALARGRRFDGEPMRLIRRALELDPKNLKALSLAGADAFGRNDAAQAIAYWQRARAQVAEAALARELDDRIAEARALKERVASSKVVPSAAVASGPVAFVSGRIVLSDRLRSKVSASDALFVFARPADGSRMPVALMRRRASELPVEFELDDSMAMVPEARLSKHARVIVGARISKRGDASPQAGDLQGFSVPVAVGTQGLRVEISEVVQ